MNLAMRMKLLMGGRGARAFVPTDIAGLQLWLKADAGTFQDAAKTTPASADTDPVGVWDDQSGNGKDATQATAGSKPLLKTNILNAKPVVRFDNVDDVLLHTAINLGTANTVFVVFIPRGTVNDVILGGTSGNYAPFTATTEVYYSTNAGTQRYVSVSASAWVTGQAYLIEIVRSGTSVSFYRDGVQLGTTQTLVVSENLTLSAIGAYADASIPTNGDIGEVLEYSAALSLADRQRVRTYLDERWNLNF